MSPESINIFILVLTAIISTIGIFAYYDNKIKVALEVRTEKSNKIRIFCTPFREVFSLESYHINHYLSTFSNFFYKMNLNTYNFIRNKQLLGELNFKWRNDCFDKFLKLFGTDFYDDMIEKILADDLISDKNLLDNSFETIRANRGLVSHENSSLNITLDEIDSSFQVCKKAFEIVIEKLNN